MSTKNRKTKAGILSAENEYRQSLQEDNFSDEPTREEELLLIKTYALDPSLDGVLWSKLEPAKPVGASFLISAKTHGIIDYAFAATLCVAPLLLGLKNKILFGLLGDAAALSAGLIEDSKAFACGAVKSPPCSRCGLAVRPSRSSYNQIRSSA
ncbi:MAG: hypothetical protein H7282_03970 [Cytophagaceae bacterium]|nr:hypothetical protein [Cytophagaceae bacterium]